MSPKPTKTTAPHRQGRHAPSAARVWHPKGVRQSRLDRIAVSRRLARRHRLCAGPAGSFRDRHGRWLCAGHPQRRLRQSSFRRRGRQCAWQHLHRAPQPDADGDHRRTTGAQPPAAAGVSLCRARLGISAALCQIQRRAGARRRRARRDRACPIMWRCSRHAGRPSSRCRSTTGTIPPSRSKPVMSAANSAPIWRRCRRWPRPLRPASALLSWSAPASTAPKPSDLMVRLAEKAKAAVVGPARSRRDAVFPERHPLFAGFLHASPAQLSDALRDP